ncbi:zinc finger protein PLAG1-like [Varroa destructor]|uniref:C2H2-type domain-containing protein n=1 Tax=Varroa destructor TaxID=109461 RepID=A0A7M7KDZ4_VARDE|nr:zinc finger protein PLAG1-like [Varroa destructor]
MQQITGNVNLRSAMRIRGLYVKHVQYGRKCLICDRVFYNNSSLRRHMERHETIRKRYNCQVCHKRFTRKDYIKDHMINVHGMLMMRSSDKALIEASLLPVVSGPDGDLDSQLPILPSGHLHPSSATTNSLALHEFMKSEAIL